jgi:putative ATP-binding cassette transporter
MAQSRRHQGVPGTTVDPDQDDVAGTAASDSEDAAHSRLVPQLGMMVRALMASPVGKTLIWLFLGILLVVVATTYGQIRLNRWSKPFYDALSRRDFRDFLYQLAVFFLIAGILLILNVAQRWLGETLKLKLREGMVGDLIRLWMLPRRAFWLANAGPIGANPDQRMHEDARHLCELSGDLGIGLLQASILLIAFTGVLWALSNDFAFHIAGRIFSIPGFMVWAAVIYAAAGSLLSYWVGGTLINRNAERYAREADLRISLVRGTASGGGAGRYPPAGCRLDQPHLGHGGFRLGHAGGPDPGRSPAVLRRQIDLRRPDDGERGLHPGTVRAALVCR